MELSGADGVLAQQATNFFAGASAPPAFAALASHGRMTREIAPESQEQLRLGLEEMGVPAGLANQLAQEDRRIGLRIYLLDNSGSMCMYDGKVLEEQPGGRFQMRGCSRWEEICGFARGHARWNLALGVPAKFMLLNGASRAAGVAPIEGQDFVKVDRSRPAAVDDLDKLLRNTTPRGGTPIAQRLQEIGALIAAEAQGLASKGQIVYLTLATDGLPTTLQGQDDRHNMVEELKHLANSLPVQMVIRLCTDDAKVVEFYNRIDEEYELPLDILDDFAGEAEEIAAAGNGFFTYTPTIHRIREAGTLFKLLDSVDEQRFNQTELRRFVEMLSPSGLAAASSNRDFVHKVQELLRHSKPVFDPISGRMQPFLNIQNIKGTLRVTGLLTNTVLAFRQFHFCAHF